MKYLGLILVVALVAGQVLARRINENDRRPKLTKVSNVTRGLSDSFRYFLEDFKITMREGNETLGIPRLDPYKNELYTIDVDHTFVSGDIQLADFEVLGLSQYKVRTAEVSVFWRQLTIGLTWPRLHSIGTYYVNGLVLNGMSLYGEGEYELTISNLSFDTVVSLGVWGGVSIKSLETKIALGGFAFSATGLYNSENDADILSQAISNMVPKLVRDHQREIVAAVNQKIITYGNKQLNGMSISDLWALFG